jgi:hypothetical protein
MLFNLKSARAEYLVLIEIVVYCAIKHSKVSIEVLKKKISFGSHHHPWGHGWLES